MPPLVVCELCERTNVEVVDITHFGGHRFEVCSNCRTIVSEMRGKIAQLPEVTASPVRFPNLNRSVNQKVDIPSDPNKTASIVWPRERPLFWIKDGVEYDLRITPCPKCGMVNTLGPANADGQPGCYACLWEALAPGTKGNQ
jgi:hypothetical protein